MRAKWVRLFWVILACVYSLCAWLPASAAQAKTYAYVNNPGVKDILHVRTKPAGKAASLSQCKNGTVVQVLGEEDDYCHVRTYAFDGYMRKEFLQQDDGWPLTPINWGWIEDERGAELRAYPDAKSPSLGTIRAFSQITVLGKAGVWNYVEIAPFHVFIQGKNGASDDILGAHRGFLLAHEMRQGNYDVENDRAIEQTYAVVSTANAGERATLYAAASAQSEALSTHLNNTQLEVLDAVADLNAQPDWLHVRAGGIEGYVQGALLRFIGKHAPGNG